MTDLGLGDDLRTFIDASPSPQHAVAELVRRLEVQDFTALSERDVWTLAPGDRRFVVRDGSSIVAFRVGSAQVAEAGFRVVGAHTDSPTFTVRPHWDVRRAGLKLVGVEPYGGALWHTWLDRELTVAGRVLTGDGRSHLVVLPGSPLRLPSLAIHLDRSVRDGLVLDPQRHLVPLWGLDVAGAPDLFDALAQQAGIDRGDIVGHDLVLADTVPSAATGADGTWIAAPRLDDLACCHSGLLALLASTPAAHTQVLVGNDHEEVGSDSAEGAGGSLLQDVLTRIVAATGDGGAQDPYRAFAASRLVSADMAHAVHPNHAERHDPLHAPRLGGGPVLKVNAQQRYATDGASGAWFAQRCASVGVPVQRFVSRADLPCGSTIGPISATRLGIPTVDVGNPLIGMHSVRELSSALDVPLMVSALTACLDDGANR